MRVVDWYVVQQGLGALKDDSLNLGIRYLLGRLESTRTRWRLETKAMVYRNCSGHCEGHERRRRPRFVLVDELLRDKSTYQSHPAMLGPSSPQVTEQLNLPLPAGRMGVGCGACLGLVVAAFGTGCGAAI